MLDKRRKLSEKYDRVSDQPKAEAVSGGNHDAETQTDAGSMSTNSHAAQTEVVLMYLRFPLFLMCLSR